MILEPLGASGPDPSSAAGRQAIYNRIIAVQSSTTVAKNFAVRLLAPSSGPLTNPQRAALSVRRDRLQANLDAIAQARNAIIEQSEGDDWLNEPVNPPRLEAGSGSPEGVDARMGGLGFMALGVPPAVAGAIVWVVKGLAVAAISVSTVYVLYKLIWDGSLDQYADVALEGMEAFNKCREDCPSNDPACRRECDSLLVATATTQAEITQGLKAQSSAQVWVAGAIGITAVAALIAGAAYLVGKRK